MFLWSDAKPEGNRLPKGMEVQMLELDWVNQHKRRDGTLPPIAYVHGELFGAGGMTAIPDNPRGSRSKSLENRCKGVGQWNRYVFVAVDGMVKLSVNGKFVNGIRDALSPKVRKSIFEKYASWNCQKVSLTQAIQHHSSNRLKRPVRSRTSDNQRMLSRHRWAWLHRR